jgi:NO-binding membrane sensor protein with MHYT domain
MEQWRQYETAGMKLLLMVLSAITLAGCGIWCTHFTGMNALDLVLDDGTALEIHFEVGLTILSFIFPVVGVFVGLKIASTDPFFLEVEATRRKNMMVQLPFKSSVCLYLSFSIPLASL